MEATVQVLQAATETITKLETAVANAAELVIGLKAQVEVLTWVVVKLSRSADQEVLDRIREGLANPASMFVTNDALAPATEKAAGDLLASINTRPV